MDFFFCSATKASVVASAVFVLHKKTDLISAPASCVHLIIIIFFVYFKILGISDPLLPLENIFKKIFLGGIFDTLQETFYGKPEESEEAAKQGNFKTNFYKIKIQNSKFTVLPVLPVLRFYEKPIHPKLIYKTVNTR